jgi:HEAT repeat protein
LVAHARDEAPEVRAAVATALGELGDGRATPVLLHALQDGSSDVQLAAIRALGRIGDDDAAQALALRLADDDRIARASAAALGRIPSRIALAALVEALVRPTVAPIVVEALRQRAPQDREAIARVLADALDAAEAPSHIEAIASAPSTERILAARLLGRIRAPRALPALRAMVGARDPNERLAAIDAIGAIGEPDGAASLVALLEDPQAVIRHLAARALARCAGSALLARFTERLRDPTPIDREALLLAIGGTTRRLRRNGEASAIPAELGPTLLEMAASSDRRLAATALAAIATWGDPALAAPLADRARRLPPSRRAPVATALGALDDRAAREALRAMAEAGDGDSAIVAWSRLGEHGGHADALWVLERATALRWPCSAAAAFAIARFARRGVLRPEDTSAICALGRSHDPWVRANVAIALAALGAAPCDGDGPDPLRWIDPPRSPVVRAAAARWLAAAASRGATGEAVARAALDRCTQSPLPGPAERACKNPALPPLDDVLDIVAWSADGRPVLERTLVALRLPDDSVLVTATDDAGRVLLAGVPSGPLVLDLPWSLPLEP